MTTDDPPIREFRCKCTKEELDRAIAAPALLWTQGVPVDLLTWRPLGNGRSLWLAEIAKTVCEAARDAKKTDDFIKDKRALCFHPAIRAGWSKRKQDEAAVDYIRRNVVKASVRWMRATDPKHARRSERDRRGDRTLLGSRRPDLFSAEAKNDIISLPRDRR